MQRSVADSYPYAFRVGQWLRLERPEWAQEFAEARPSDAALPLQQACDYALAAYCEENKREEFDDILATKFFPSAPKYLQIEMLNTVRWYSEQLDPGPEAREIAEQAH